MITSMQFNTFLRKNLKILRIVKKYVNINTTDILTSVLGFYNNIVKGIVFELLEKTVNITLKILSFILTHLFMGFLTSFCIALPVYYQFPALFTFGLDLLGLDISELSVHEKLVNKETRVANLENQLLELKEQQILKDIELRKIYGERDGIITGIQKVQLEKINWWNIIGTVAGITVVSSVVLYAFFSGADPGFFRPILSSIGDGNLSLTRLVTQSSEQVNTNLVTTVDKLGLMETTLNLLNNAVSSLTRDIEDLIRKK